MGRMRVGVRKRGEIAFPSSPYTQYFAGFVAKSFYPLTSVGAMCIETYAAHTHVYLHIHAYIDTYIGANCIHKCIHTYIHAHIFIHTDE